MVEINLRNRYLQMRNTVFAVICIILGSAQVSAKVGIEDIKHAVYVLKNIDTDITKEKAITILENAAVNDTSAYAMNCLGLAYMAGVGVDADSIKAVKWLENAGLNGYADAYHNLGIMFKYFKCGVAQDMKKAYTYYSIGADSGSVVCMYEKGFMLYKGLGCQQSYSEAVKCFREAVSYNHAPSLYMLGLCYRNGYGVEMDPTTATDYLNRAKMLGYRDAADELLRPNPENYLHDVYIGDAGYSYIPDSAPEIAYGVNDTDLLTGRFNGFMVMYDWSGKFILAEKPVTMSIVNNNKDVTGRMVLGTDTVPFKALITDNGKLLFKDSRIRLNERYNVGAINYRMENAALDIWKDKICGRLYLYSLKLKEPERPIYFEICREGKKESTDDEKHNRIAISPNPFEYEFSLTFEQQNEAETQVRIFDKFGMMVWQQDLGNLGKGNHTVMLSPDIMPGTYVISIKAGVQMLRSIIIKKGGL